MMFHIKSINADEQVFEEIYTKLVNEDTTNADQIIPFEYKFEFLHLFWIIFYNNKYFSKAETAFNIICFYLEDNLDSMFVVGKYV